MKACNDANQAVTGVEIHCYRYNISRASLVAFAFLEEGVCYYQCLLLAKLYQLFPCFILYSKTKFAYYSRCFLTSYFRIPASYNERTSFLGVSSKRSCRSSQNRSTSASSALLVGEECSNYHTIALISHASKVMLKILQARLQQYMNRELPDVQAGFRKGRGTGIKLPTSAGSCKKQESSRKTSIYALLTMPKPLTVWITINCRKFFKRWEYWTT